MFGLVDADLVERTRANVGSDLPYQSRAWPGILPEPFVWSHPAQLGLPGVGVGGCSLWGLPPPLSLSPCSSPKRQQRRETEWVATAYSLGLKTEVLVGACRRPGQPACPESPLGGTPGLDAGEEGGFPGGGLSLSLVQGCRVKVGARSLFLSWVRI